MSLQTIQLNGRGFVLVPEALYKANKKQIDGLVSEDEDSSKDDYVPFVLDDYFQNPVALERIRRRITQRKLAKLLGCSQAYVSQLESSEKVPKTIIAKVKKALKNYPDIWAEMPK